MRSIRKRCSSLIRKTAVGLRRLVGSGGTTTTETDVSGSETTAGTTTSDAASSYGSCRRLRRRASQQRRSRRNRQLRSYARYVRALMRTIHPRRRISQAAIEVMDCFLSDMQVRLSEEARQLCRKAGRRTMQARDVRAAVQLLLPGQLAEHARREADAALQLANGAASVLVSAGLGVGGDAAGDATPSLPPA